MTAFRVVGDPHGTVLQRVHRIFLTVQRLRIHDPGTGRPSASCRSAERRRLVVGDPLGGVDVDRGTVVVLGDAGDLRRRVGIGRRRDESVRRLQRVLRDASRLSMILGADPEAEPDEQSDDRDDSGDDGPIDVANAGRGNAAGLAGSFGHTRAGF